MSWTPAVASLTEVIDAVSTEVPRLFAFRAASANGRGRRVGRGGAAFRVGLVSRAFAPCPVAMNMCIKFLEVINNASSCEAGVDKVGDEELFRVPDDVQNAMANGSGNGGGDDGV